MIYLRTGVPGAGKTLNTLKEICEDEQVTQKQKFYNNIKCFLLDLDFCNSFAGWFYGSFFPAVAKTKKGKRYSKIIKKAHEEGRLVEISDAPWLSPLYKVYDERAAIELFSTWCRRCYPKKNLIGLDTYLEEAEEPTIESIKLLNYHWTKVDDPTQWPDLPNGSISVFDECQDYFSPMANSAKRPLHYTKFQTHRHTGVDIHLVTQHYTFLDNVIQKCTNSHIHYFRPMGGAAITRFQRDKQFNTDYKGDLEKCATKMMRRDSNFYGVYWSADEHTAKFKIPPKLYLGFLAIPILIYVIYSLAQNLGMLDKGEPTTGEPPVTVIPETKLSIKPQKKLLSDLDYKPQKFEHPLNEMCDDYEYGGYVLKKNHGVVTVEHYINCVTGNHVERQKTSIMGEGENEVQQAEQIKEPEVITLSSNYLEKIGYSIYLSENLPVLKFSDKNIFLRQF